MGVSFFRETAQEDFATFDRSFFAMCEGWGDGARERNPGITSIANRSNKGIK